MFVSKIRIGAAVLAWSALSMVGTGVVRAEGVRVVVEPPPVFVPHAEFKFEDGYYRTHDGHYYHYDRDRDGWHYGRNHEEGMRYEKHRGRK